MLFVVNCFCFVSKNFNWFYFDDFFSLKKINNFKARVQIFETELNLLKAALFALTLFWYFARYQIFHISINEASVLPVSCLLSLFSVCKNPWPLQNKKIILIRTIYSQWNVISSNKFSILLKNIVIRFMEIKTIDSHE